MGEEDLRQFLKAWLEWAEAGGKIAWPFYRSVGLCVAAHNWAVFSDFSDERRRALYSSLTLALPIWNLHPFGGADLYCREAEEELMHLNDLRLAWVRRQLCQTS